MYEHLLVLVQLSTWSYELRLIDIKVMLSNHFPSTPTIRSNNNSAVYGILCTVYYYMYNKYNNVITKYNGNSYNWKGLCKHNSFSPHEPFPPCIHIKPSGEAWMPACVYCILVPRRHQKSKCKISEVKQEHGSTQFMSHFQPFAMITAMIAATMSSNVQIEIRREFKSPDTCIGRSHFSANATIH